MQQIIVFFIRNKNFLLFLLLFGLSVFLTINSHSFHKNKAATSANAISGGIYSVKQNVLDYFNLREQNDILVEENRRLRQLISKSRLQDSSAISSLNLDARFKYVSARVINNSYSKTKNNLTLDAGANDGLKIDMGVISSLGVVGIVNSVSANFATVQSLLNTKSQINAKLKTTGNFGSLIWRGGNPYEAILTDIPRQAIVKVGDTIVTDGKSTIFPQGILIGTVKDFVLANNQDYYEVMVSLSNDMTNIRHVYVIENSDAQEINALEELIEDAE